MIDAKKLKVLALCIERKADYAPEIPAVVELGYKLAFVSYLGVFGPEGLPDEVVKKLDEVIHKISEEQGFRTKVNNMGTQLNYEPTASFEKTLLRYRDNLQAFFKEEGLVK